MNDMLVFFQNGGIFSLLVLALAGAALVLNTMQLMGSERGAWTPMILSLTGATLLVGIGGTAVGFYEAFQAFASLPLAQQQQVTLKVMGIASAPTAQGALLAALNLLLLGFHYVGSPRQERTSAPVLQPQDA